jgi:hypothetical protein
MDVGGAGGVGDHVHPRLLYLVFVFMHDRAPSLA